MRLAHGATGVGAVLLVVAVGVSVAAHPTGTSTSGVPAALGQLTVAPPESTEGYRREKQFGGWVDADHDCLDTRQEVLVRDMEARVMASGGCAVIAGVLLEDPYTGKTVRFDRARKSTGVQADHVVALRDAWDSGASRWTRGQRVKFANDLSNLVATEGTVNAKKGSSGPDKWSPARSGQCEYARRYTRVKVRYRLTVTRTEWDALVRMLDTCGGGS